MELIIIMLAFIVFLIPIVIGVTIDRIEYWQDVKKYGKEETEEIYRRW